jgi:hypothetical protein
VSVTREKRARAAACFHIELKLFPRIIRDLSAIRKYLAGIICVTALIREGIFLMGKTNPESVNVGRTVATTEIRKAVSWVEAMVEIRSPRPRQARRKRIVIISSAR